MALVSEIVARFKAETTDWQAKTDAMKAKNQQVAKELVKAAGDADSAVKTLQLAARNNALADIGVSKGQVNGIISQIKNVAKEAEAAGAKTSQALGGGIAEAGKQAKGLNAVFKGLDAFASGDFLKGLSKLRLGANNLGVGDSNFGASIFKGGLALGGINFVGGALDEATKKMLELKKAFKEGSISAGEVAEKALASVPVYGKVWEAGRNIRDIIGLENTDLEDQNKLLGGINDSRQKSVDLAKMLREHAEAEARATADLYKTAQVKALEAAGRLNVARDQGLRDSRDQAYTTAADASKKYVDEQKSKVEAELNAGDGKGGKSLRQQLRDAEDAKRAADDKVAQNGTATGDAYDQEELEADRKKAADAADTLGQIQATIRQKQHDLDAIVKQSADQLAERNKAIDENYQQERAAAFTKVDPVTNKRRQYDPSELDRQDQVKQQTDFLKPGFEHVVDAAKTSGVAQMIRDAVDATAGWATSIKAEAARLTTQALKLREEAMTPLQKQGQEVDEAVKASRANPGIFGKDQLQGLLQGREDSLQKQLAEKESQRGKSSDPVKEKENLAELKLIKNLMQQLVSKASDAGVNIQVIQ